METRAHRAFSEVRGRRGAFTQRKGAIEQFEMAGTEALTVHGHGGRHTALPPRTQTGSAPAGSATRRQ
jgi:hypothetical protein